ncbi:hypothetical protein K3495_g9456 [Podosphaera aphanis]|nr:hypothetical protein K3495_g9456 [Podosphaera aphanis]
MVAIKNRTISRTGFSPFFLTHGYHLEPIKRRYSPSSSGTNPKARANAFIYRLHEGQELAKAAMAAAQQIMEHNATKGRRPAEKLKTLDVYELDVPSNIHPRFFVDLLCRDSDDLLPSQVTDDSQPPPLLGGKHPLYAVEKILRAESFQGKRFVCVKYKDYKETSWELRENLVLTDAFKTFIEQYGDGDNVGDPNSGSYTGSRGKKKPSLKKYIYI